MPELLAVVLCRRRRHSCCQKALSLTRCPIVRPTQLSVGVGALAGSTIMLLTIPWFLAVYAGRVDLDSSGKPVYRKVCAYVSVSRYLWLFVPYAVVSVCDYLYMSSVIVCDCICLCPQPPLPLLAHASGCGENCFAGSGCAAVRVVGVLWLRLGPNCVVALSDTAKPSPESHNIYP